MNTPTSTATKPPTSTPTNKLTNELTQTHGQAQTQYRIAVLDDYQGAALRHADWAPVTRDASITVFNDTVRGVDALAERLAPFHIVCAMRERTRFDAALIERLPNLKMIASSGSWNAAIDLEAAGRAGITVCGTSGLSTATPEFTWAVILAAARHLPQELESVHSGGWQQNVGVDLHGRTLGLLGLGLVGSAVARVGLAFGMEVIAWSQNLTPERAAEAGVRLVSRDDLFRESDVLSIHTRLSPRTQGLVDEAAFSKMKSTAILVNTSRGAIVDQAAMLAALKSRRLASAAVDVYDEEPLPATHPLRNTPNLMATPHLGYVTEGTYRRFFGQTVENIRNWMDGKPTRVMAPD